MSRRNPVRHFPERVFLSPLIRIIGCYSTFAESFQQRRAYSTFRDAYFQLVSINPERSRHRCDKAFCRALDEAVIA
jgi:hypothetical protein